MTKKVAVFLQNGFELIEATTPIDLFRRAGLEVTTLSLEGDLTVKSMQEVSVLADELAERANLDVFDAIFLPGGAIDVDKYLKFQDIFVKFKADGKLLSAICAAPYTYAKAGLLQNTPATVYPSMHAMLSEEGADYRDQHVVVSAPFITGQAPGASWRFALTVIENLADAETLARVKSETVYQGD